MIRTSGLRKVFRTDGMETYALDGVSIEVGSGEFVSIMGPSGCGKSTLMNILGLLDSPTEGAYSLLGEEVSRYSEAARTELRRGRIGFVFQSFNLVDELSVYENVELPLVYMRVPASRRAERAAAVMERMGIAHLRDRFPQQLSGGQQQRAAVARAIVAGPRLILADEPTGNLDSRNGDEVMNILLELNREGATIVMVTHSPTYAAYSGRVIRLFDGKVAGEDGRGTAPSAVVE
jgi:putative ABC transport system ATP-binding protein